MKKYTIGRNNNCDIIIPDTTDLVSRQQAIITIPLFGKMVIYDTSNNGTTVNGRRIEKNMGCPVSRNDKVVFAGVAPLDWNLVPRPYRGMRILIVLAFVLAMAVGAGAAYFTNHPFPWQTEVVGTEVTDTIVTDSAKVDTPAEPASTHHGNYAKPAPKPSKPAKKNNKKSNNQGSSDNYRQPTNSGGSNNMPAIM